MKHVVSTHVGSRWLPLVGLVGLILAARIGGADTETLFSAYLIGLYFSFTIALGSLQLSAVYTLVGGSWGERLSPLWRSAGRSLPCLGLLFLPLLVWHSSLYPWPSPSVSARWYFNAPGLWLRTVLLLIVWSVFAGSHRSERSRVLFSSLTLVSIFFGFHFFAVDWVQSLEPHFVSSIYPLWLLSGTWVAAAAFSILAISFSEDRRDLFHRRGIDYGNLMICTLALFAYLFYAQYLILWSGQLPHEITYFTARRGGWMSLAKCIGFFLVIVPLLFLWARATKRSPRAMRWLSAIVLAMHFAALLWIIVPAVSPTIHWVQVVVPPASVAVLASYWHRYGRGGQRA